MKGDPIPDHDHILRYIGAAHLDKDLDSGEWKILGSGFLSRPRDRNSVSYNWIEYYCGNLSDQITQIRQCTRLDYGATARLARLNMGKICQYLKKQMPERNAITVTHDPLEAGNGKPGDPSHALMHNVLNNNDPQSEMFGDFIAHCVRDTFPALPENA